MTDGGRGGGFLREARTKESVAVKAWSRGDLRVGRGISRGSVSAGSPKVSEFWGFRRSVEKGLADGLTGLSRAPGKASLGSKKGRE